jgi:predicted acetyltransferase
MTELRPITPDEFDAYFETFEAAFGEDEGDDARELWRGLTEFDRAVAMFDGDQMVGTGGNVTLELTVAGGTVPMGGVTAIGVLPSHRRRGLLNDMMRHLLDDAREHGEPLAGLWASESTIYGRFGFGWAATGLRFRITTPHAGFVVPADHRGLVRMVDVDEALAAFPPIYEAVRAQTPGMLHRSPGRWSWLERDPESWRDGAGPRFLAVIEDRGYVIYRIKAEWTPAGPEHTCVVLELVAADDDAHALLWRWCLDLDLVGKLSAEGRSPDDPLPHLLADPRRLEVSTQDTLWLCVLDVPTALCARSYPVDGSLVLRVTDGWMPGVDGAYRLEVDDGRAACERVDAEPDITVRAASLGAAYLGDQRLGHLARAGLVTEHTPGALARADLMLTPERPPWCPWEF